MYILVKLMKSRNIVSHLKRRLFSCLAA